MGPLPSRGTLPTPCFLVSRAFQVSWLVSCLQYKDRGQGLNNAMQDAADLVIAIKSAVAGNSSLKEGVTAYEDKMRPRGARDVALSLETATKLRISNLRESPMFVLGLQKMDDQKVVAVPNAVQLLADSMR